MTEPTDTELLLELSFRLESVSPVPDPAGGTAIWHRYIISQGPNTITGMRAGALAQLMPELELMVDRLNERTGRKLAKARR